jgi:NDP-sugar pyrophosphorylase family protein
MSAAGMGSRFREQGFPVSKPFIEVLPGVPMYRWVIDSYGLEPSDVEILILRKDEELLAQYGDTFKAVHYLEDVSPGPAFSAMALALMCDPPREGPVIIFDCDCSAHVDLKYTMTEAVIEGSSGVIAYEDKSGSEEYSFLNNPAKYHSAWRKTAVFHGLSEKLRISDYINTGCYWFRNVDDMADAFLEAERNRKPYAELPLSAVINGITRLPLRYFETRQFTNLGTPEHLAEFQRRNEARF